MRMAKFLHNWLYIGEMKQLYYQSDTDKCPVCMKEKETWTHLYKCKHELAVSSPLHMYSKLWSDLLKAKMAPCLKQIILYKFQQWCGDDSEPPIVPQDEMDLLLLEALETQNELG
eukprot:8050170-Ditylum_brightwellii.AAC.1